MIKRIYEWAHAKLSRPEERGEYSSGIWQDLVRQQALDWCVNSKLRVLEVGCGEGLFLSQLKIKNPALQLWGIDNSSVRIGLAQSRISDKDIHLSVGDAARLSFEDDFFDAAVCINVFFNMPSKNIVKETLIQMKRTVNRGGMIIFDFRNAANPVLAIKYGLAPFYDRTVKGLPLKTYHLGEMEKLLKEIGLEIIEKKPIGTMALFGVPIIIIKARKI